MEACWRGHGTTRRASSLKKSNCETEEIRSWNFRAAIHWRGLLDCAFISGCTRAAC